MHVIATAGHVDHGKSTLVRALTGMEPDRWAEERRRGMTIDLGFAWLTLPGGEKLAFVDVPGHERFVPNMLAGLGPVPAVMFIVAADGGWMPQSAEHLAAIDALGVRHGLLVITRADLADPGPAERRATAQIARTSLGAVEVIPVSAVTGAGLPGLRDALGRLAAEMSGSSGAGDAAVRLWLDRAFTIKGSGTVVTGTLPAGSVRNGEELMLAPAMLPVRVRSLQVLGEPASEVTGVARVALNLRGVPPDVPGRGMALIHRDRWTLTSQVDIRIEPGAAGLPDKLPAEPLVHIGSARTPARLRVFAPGGATLFTPGGRPPVNPRQGGETPLSPPSPGEPGRTRRAPGPLTYRAGDDPLLRPGLPPAGATRLSTGAVFARLALRDPLPLHVGDRLLLRDPGTAAASGPARGTGAAEPMGHAVILGATVLDVAPPPLRRRGGGAAAARELGRWPAVPQAADLVRRHGLLRIAALTAMGITEAPAPAAGDWAADPAHWEELRAELRKRVAEFAARDPLAPGMPAEAARAALGLPSREMIAVLAKGVAALEGGYLKPAGAPATSLPPRVAHAVRQVLADLAAHPFAAPDAQRLRDLGLDGKAIATAARGGLLLRIADQIVLAPDADRAAAAILGKLPQPFTTSQARQALGTSRRVAIPLLEHLDRKRLTERLPGDLRRVNAPE